MYGVRKVVRGEMPDKGHLLYASIYWSDRSISTHVRNMVHVLFTHLFLVSQVTIVWTKMCSQKYYIVNYEYEYYLILKRDDYKKVCQHIFFLWMINRVHLTTASTCRSCDAVHSIGVTVGRIVCGAETTCWVTHSRTRWC